MIVKDCILPVILLRWWYFLSQFSNKTQSRSPVIMICYVEILFSVIDKWSWQWGHRLVVSAVQPRNVNTAVQDVLCHYNDVIMSAMVSQITSFTFTQPFIQSQIKENSPVTGEFPAQRGSNAENISIDDVIMFYACVCLFIGWFYPKPKDCLYQRSHPEEYG